MDRAAFNTNNPDRVLDKLHDMMNSYTSIYLPMKITRIPHDILLEHVVFPGRW